MIKHDAEYENAGCEMMLTGANHTPCTTVALLENLKSRCLVSPLD